MCGGTCLFATVLHFTCVHPDPLATPTRYILSYIYYVSHAILVLFVLVMIGQVDETFE